MRTYKNPIVSTSGLRRNRPLLAPLVRKTATEKYTRGGIIDFSRLLMTMSRDKSLILINNWFTIQQIIGSLIEDPLLPLECPTILDDLCRKIDECPKHREQDFTERLAIVGMSLDNYSLLADQCVQRTVGDIEADQRYEVRWLGDNSAIVSVSNVRYPRNLSWMYP